MSMSLRPLAFLLLGAAIPLGISATTSAPQDPVPEEKVTNVRVAQIQYTKPDGTIMELEASTVLQLRLITGKDAGYWVEIYFRNGDYTLVRPEGFSLLRSGAEGREIRLIRSVGTDNLVYPELK